MAMTASTSSRRGSSTSGRTKSIPCRLRPHPYEFALYFDIWSTAWSRRPGAPAAAGRSGARRAVGGGRRQPTLWA